LLTSGRHGYEIIIRQPEHAVSEAKNLSNQSWQHQEEVPKGRAGVAIEHLRGLV